MLNRLSHPGTPRVLIFKRWPGEVTLEQRPEGSRGAGHADIWKESFLHRDKSKFKASEMGAVWLLCSRIVRRPCDYTSDSEERVWLAQ